MYSRFSNWTYPNIPPEPNMYLPRVRMTPLGPAPYWRMVTVPLHLISILDAKMMSRMNETLTENETHDSTDS